MAGRKEDTTYGKLVSASEAQMVDLPEDEPREQSTLPTDVGNMLYEYRASSTICGVPVADEDKDLPILSDDVLVAAFVLDCRPRLLFTRIKPDDTESRKEYDELLEKVHQGKARMVDETKQFDVQSGSFIVWVRYEEMCYKLHPRYEYLRNE